MSVQAVATRVRISPRKVSVVAGLVRGRSVADALTILEHTPRRGAIPLSKVIKSARANAEHNHNYKPDTLKITMISVTNGPVLKRYRPVSRGMAHPFLRRSSFIKVIVDGEQRAAKKPATKQVAKEETK